MMLASTVQFSRYGRFPAACALAGVPAGPGPRRAACGRSLRTQQRARPADPSLPRSPPAEAGVLTGAN
jgi:hypothetical protein